MSNRHWLDRAKETYKFHRAKCILDKTWNITKTSNALHRSYGSIAEDIKIASWLKTHSEQLERFEFIHEALAYIRKKQNEMDLADLD